MLRPGHRLWFKGSGELSADEVREVRAGNRETTQCLTNGQQHALEVLNGHAISLVGGTPFVEVPASITLDELIEAVDSLPKQKRKRR
jgi:hypothetical protein